MGETEAPLCENTNMEAMSAFDWDDLRFFLAVARAGRLTAAARQLEADHTTVSRRISALEPRSRPSCSSASPQGYTLTEQGERLLAKAETMETQALAVASEIGGADLALSGTVRIGAPDGIGTYFLAPELGALAERHPGLTLQLVALPRTFSLSKREADIAVTLEQPTEGRLVSRKLTDYRLRLYASQDYLDRHGPVAELSDLAGKTLVTYVAGPALQPGARLFLGPREIHRPPLRMRQRGGPGRGGAGRNRHRHPARLRGAAVPGASGRAAGHLVSAHLLARHPRGRALLAPCGGGLFLHPEPGAGQRGDCFRV